MEAKMYKCNFFVDIAVSPSLKIQGIIAIITMVLYKRITKFALISCVIIFAKESSKAVEKLLINT
jgi:hypothetical protein